MASLTASLNATVKVFSDTGSFTEAKNTWSYISPGKITEVKPNRGQYGTRVTLVGTNLLAAGQSVASVTLAGVQASLMKDENGTQLSSDTAIKVEAAASGSNNEFVGDVKIVANTGASITKKSSFTYVPPASIFSVLPNAGLDLSLIHI